MFGFIKGVFVQAAAFAFASAFVVACSSSNDEGGFAGGTTEDAGIIADLNVAGVTQKGPFVKGSAVTVQGIDCKTLKFTEEKFEGKVKSDKGDFEVKDVNLSSTCAVFEVTGAYLNEVTGKKTKDKLTLHALTDLKDRKNVNINVLTELEYERVMNLVSKEKMSFAEAKEQAEKEVLASFNIKGDVAGSIDEAEDLNIFEKGDGNAALLAVSVMVLADANESKLAERLDDFSTAISKNGSLDESAKTEIANLAATAASSDKLDTIRKNIESWNVGDTVAAFETFVKTIANGDSVTLSSDGKKGASSSSVTSAGSVTLSSSSSQNVILSASDDSSSSSEFFDWNVPKQSYFNPNIKYDSIVDSRDGKVYKTVKIGNQVWMAENLNYDDSVKTPSLKGNSWCYDGDPKKCNVTGRLYSWAAAIDSVKFLNAGMKCGDYTTCPFLKKVQGICPDGWHLPDTTEWNALMDAVGENAGTVLKSQRGWYDNGNGTDSVGFSVIPTGYFDKVDGLSYRVGLNAGFWSTVEYGKYTVFYTPFEYSSDFAYKESVAHKGDGNSIRCIKGEADEIVGSSSSSVPLSSSSSNSVYDAEKNTLKDLRDDNTYKTVKIGNQIWMAENLKYKAEGSHCYGDVDSNCDKYGPLYDWATAKNACPTDWRLPTTKEMETLFTAAGGKSTAGKALKSKTGWPKGDGFDWNGTDEVSFTALPGGRWEHGGPYSHESATAYFWSSTAYNESSAYFMYFDYDKVEAKIDFNLKIHALSVRCIKAETSVTSSSSSSAKSSSSVDLESWRWDVPKEARFNPDIAYDSITDSRDNKVYKIVKIGNQVWMAENLNYDDSVTTTSLKGKSWCYNNKPKNCDVGGRLYTWAAAVDSVKLATDKDNPLDCGHGKLCYLDTGATIVRGICPMGWHLPDSLEWNVLFTTVGGLDVAAKMLKSKTGWYNPEKPGNGTDAYGFSGLPVGDWFLGSFSSEGTCAQFWSVSELDDFFLYSTAFLYLDDVSFSLSRRHQGLSVRCIKD